MVIQNLIFPCLLAISSLSEAATVTFDLRNLSKNANGWYDVSAGGVDLSFSPSGMAKSQIVSTVWGLGVDSGYAGEASGFINGNVMGGGKAESLFFLFSKDVVIESVSLVWNSAGVVPIICPKGAVSQNTVLGNGTTLLPDLKVGRTSANTLMHSTSGYFPADGGFAIRSITVATIPEPSPGVLGGIGAAAGLLAWRRRGVV